MNEVTEMPEAEKLDILIGHSKHLIKLTEDIIELRKEFELEGKLNDLMFDKHQGMLKWLFKLIVHLAKNGEIRTMLEASFNKKKVLDIVVAFDGDEGGRKAMNRFAIEQLCGDPKKFKIGANLEKRINILQEEHNALHSYVTSNLSKRIPEQPIKKRDVI